jgi:hypothetical protein
MLMGVIMAGVFLTCFAVGAVHSQVPGVVPDLSIWVNTWFKVYATLNVYSFADIGVKPYPSYPVSETNPGYIKITGWDSGTHTLTANLYMKHHPSAPWDPNFFIPLGFNYFVGSDLKFSCTTRGQANLITISGSFFFKGKRNDEGKFILNGVTLLKTTGAYILRIDDTPNSTNHWGGSMVLAGSMIRETKVPPVLLSP